jgi:AraC family transcriptional regulator of adaptative response/methylated-DNA-[protein]-cysteine methyltransferase
MGNCDEEPSTVSIRTTVRDCSLGSVLVAATTKGVCAILLGDEPESLTRELRDRFPDAVLTDGDAALDDVADRVVGLVEQPTNGFDVPLDVRGTEFQRRVWNALRDIPTGRTASYRDVAIRIGAPKSVRAVARACAANTLAVAIPCHRVVRADGGLWGYRWGVDRKRRLLEREAA